MLGEWWCLPLPYPCVCLAKLLTTASTASLRMVLARASDTEPATGRRLGGTGGADFVFDLAMLDVMPTHDPRLSRDTHGTPQQLVSSQWDKHTREKHTDFPFAFSHEYSERAGKSENTRAVRQTRRLCQLLAALLCSRMDELSLRPDRWRPA